MPLRVGGHLKTRERLNFVKCAQPNIQMNMCPGHVFSVERKHVGVVFIRMLD
jgi:hypothetical protein